jgi:hypothetical protein
MTWVDVDAVSTSWAEISSYVVDGYVAEGYVTGDKLSGNWAAEGSDSTTWVDE